MSENPTENDNWQLPNKPSFADVETLAHELCKEYSNDKFFYGTVSLLIFWALSVSLQLELCTPTIKTKRWLQNYLVPALAKKLKAKLAFQNIKH